MAALGLLCSRCSVQILLTGVPTAASCSSPVLLHGISMIVTRLHHCQVMNVKNRPNLYFEVLVTSREITSSHLSW